MNKLTAGEDSGNDLGSEHGARGNLHVVTKLEVRSEGQRLGHGNVAPGLEHHHGDGVARESVSDDEFGDDVETDLLVSDSLDHANGNDVHEGCKKKKTSG
jgi:hypothetical protein